MSTIYRNGFPPSLKNGVDIQLQSAFADENWPTVIRLADRRAKMSADSYYEVIKIGAESQLDGAVEKSAAAVAVDLWIRNGTVPKDIESLELLEWGCAGAHFPQNYSETFGVLRLRWAKANTKDATGLVTCLKECLLNWDLVNSQQIAAILDKSSHSNDGRFMYWNILLMHMLSTSPQCPSGKQKIYGMLAQKQLEKAAELATENSKGQERSLREEEEFLLYYRVLSRHGSAEDFAKCAQNPNTGALKQLHLGRKQLFVEALSHLEGTGQWGAVFDLCHKALQASDSLGRPSTLACDLQIWKSFVVASKKQQDWEKAFDTIQQVLQRFIASKAEIPQMFTKTIGIALLEVTFNAPPSVLDVDSEASSSPRVEQLFTYIKANLEKPSIFEDVNRFVEKLSFSEAKDLLEKLDSLPEDGDITAGFKAHHTVLRSKLQYLLATCPQTLWPKIGTDVNPTLTCKICSQPADPSGCNTCFLNIALGSLKAHAQLSKDESLAGEIPRLSKDPRVDLTLVSASCLLQLAGIHRSHQHTGRPPVSFQNWKYFLQATILLDHQLQQTPDDIPLRLLLVRVHLLLGSAMQALQLWTPLGVKRTILDALGPLFFDRLSTISPALFHGTTPLTNGLRMYYDTVLQRMSSVKIWDAFSSASYSSILDMAQLNDNLHHSCTRAMAVLEERRAARLLGGKLEDVDAVSIFADVTNDVDLINVTDYGSMPNLSSLSATSLAGILSIGPDLSNTRMHLGLLSEKFLDLIGFKPQKEYKPAKQNDVAQRDRAYILEMLTSIESSFMEFLHRSDTPSHLTAAEQAHYTVLSLLCSLAVTGLATNPATPPSSHFVNIMSSLMIVYGIARTSILNQPITTNVDVQATLRTLTNLHGMAMFREMISSIKHTAAFLVAFHDKEMTRDRTSKSGLHKDVIAGIRTLKTTASQAFADIKVHIKSNKDRLNEPGLQNAITEWITHASVDNSIQNNAADNLSQAILDVVGGKEEVENWSEKLLTGWKETMKGWAMVQLE